MHYWGQHDQNIQAILWGGRYPVNIVSNGGLTLSAFGGVYTYTGNGINTWTLPLQSNSIDARLVLANRGTNSVIVNTNGGENKLQFNGVLINTLTILSGQTYVLHNNSLNFIVIDYYSPADLTLKANISSPVFTGVPLAPTPANGNDSTQIATTAFVKSTISSRFISNSNTTDVVTKAFLNTTYPLADHPIGTVVSYFNKGLQFTRVEADNWTTSTVSFLA